MTRRRCDFFFRFPYYFIRESVWESHGISRSNRSYRFILGCSVARPQVVWLPTIITILLLCIYRRSLGVMYINTLTVHYNKQEAKSHLETVQCASASSQSIIKQKQLLAARDSSERSSTLACTLKESL